MKTEIGGQGRIGSGQKMEVETSEYNKSTHNLNYIWRSTMSFGTCVPFANYLALPGDEWEIQMEAIGQTGPTNGPAFAGAKQQYDIFTADLRLYNAIAHNNPLDIGLVMEQVKLPQYEMDYDITDGNNSQIPPDELDNFFTEPSSLLRYLGINGMGSWPQDIEPINTYRLFNGTSILAYYDIMKNYYANKMEENAYVIHKGSINIDLDIHIDYASDNFVVDINEEFPIIQTPSLEVLNYINLTDTTSNIKNENVFLEGYYQTDDGSGTPETTNVYGTMKQIIDDMGLFTRDGGQLNKWNFNNPTTGTGLTLIGGNLKITNIIDEDSPNPNYLELFSFPLKNFDLMRNRILKEVDNPNALIINKLGIAPYNLFEEKLANANSKARNWSQEGLFLKTYQSDVNNNWINSDIIVGENGVNELSALNIEDDKLYISDLIISNKIFELLNDIAVAGNNLSGWINAVWGKEYYRDYEIPVYWGGMSQNLVFKEVESNSAAGIESTEQPLGTLAGRGVSSNKNGGTVKIRVNQPCIIMGIVSATPYIDYYQFNDWTTGLKTWNDFHKPKLDGIGFQDLITDKIHWGSTELQNTPGEYTLKSIGKQPAWIDYQTNYNKVYGNFAKKNNQQWMVFTRDYQRNEDGVWDFTTYIDPVKFNNIFAYTELDAQNIWQQIKVNMKVSRIMSYKLMPKL